MGKIKSKEAVTELKGSLHLKYIRGGDVARVDTGNLIVTAGRAALAKLLGGLTGMHVTKVGVGTGSDPALSTDTDITDAVKVDITEARIGTGLEAEDGTTFDDPRVVQFHFVFGTSVANGIAIHEYGLFCADGGLFSHVVRDSPITKTSLDKIVGFWQIQF